MAAGESAELQDRSGWAAPAASAAADAVFRKLRRVVTNNPQAWKDYYICRDSGKHCVDKVSDTRVSLALVEHVNGFEDGVADDLQAVGT